ncbi:CheR family methyltransferase [Microvirga sp. M2]|uniref:CheR family methyltransferase n=1 Tax=Microvirga sp. M2 TaxID=3073270 RepID=UPI0039C07B23
MRDKAPFGPFQNIPIPRYLKDRAASRRLGIRCAAASTGQEPYSLAMLLKEASGRMPGWHVQIIAAGISDEVLERARAGIYKVWQMSKVFLRQKSSTHGS